MVTSARFEARHSLRRAETRPVPARSRDDLAVEPTTYPESRIAGDDGRGRDVMLHFNEKVRGFSPD
jgi:hypothetical protein